MYRLHHACHCRRVRAGAYLVSSPHGSALNVFQQGAQLRGWCTHLTCCWAVAGWAGGWPCFWTWRREPPSPSPKQVAGFRLSTPWAIASSLWGSARPGHGGMYTSASVPDPFPWPPAPLHLCATGSSARTPSSAPLHPSGAPPSPPPLAQHYAHTHSYSCSSETEQLQTSSTSLLTDQPRCYHARPAYGRRLALHGSTATAAGAPSPSLT